MVIPNCDTLWRTDTGHCIAQTFVALPSEILSVPGEIQIRTTTSSVDSSSRQKEQNGSVTLTLSPTPIASTIQVVANFSSSKANSTLKSKEALHIDPPSTPVSGKSSPIVAGSPHHGSTESMDGGHHSNSNSSNNIKHMSHHHPPHQPRRSGSQSHTFLYRWFHPESNASGAAQDSNSNVTTTEESNNDREGSMNSIDVESSSNNGGSTSGSRKHTLIYRLLHPGETHHHDHSHDDDDSCIAPHPPKSNDSPLTHRRYALLQKLFHHAENNSESSSSSPGFGSLYLSIPRRHKKQGSTSGNHTSGSADHSENEDQLKSTRSSAASEEDLHSPEKHINPEPLSTVPSTRDEDKVEAEPEKKMKKSASVLSSKEESTGSVRRFYIFRNLLVPHKRNASSSSNNSEASHQSASPQLSSSSVMSEKYGQAEKVIGKGAGGTVRLFHKLGFSGPSDKLYAVKEFRKRRKNETEKDYIKKLASEFCISSNLHHVNVVETIDLVQDEKHRWCEIMEYVIVAIRFLFFSVLEAICMRFSEMES
jgi:hypothetical protein